MNLRGVFVLFRNTLNYYGLDPDPHRTGTFAWIRIRNKSFRIHNTAGTVTCERTNSEPNPYVKSKNRMLKQFMLTHKHKICKEYYFFYLKGQSNKILDPNLFDQWVKIFLILVKISRVIQIILGIILRWVILPAVYYTAPSQSPYCIILWGVLWLFRILFKGTFTTRFST